MEKLLNKLLIKKQFLQRIDKMSIKQFNKYCKIVKDFSKTRYSFRQEFYNVYNVEPQIYAEFDENDIEYGRLYFCSDYLNETIRDIEIKDGCIYFTADFKPYHFDGMLTGRFYIFVENPKLNYVSLEVFIDNTFKITIKEKW